MPIKDTELGIELTREVLFPIKWSAEIIDTHTHPYEFYAFIMDKCEDWMGPENYEEYISNWTMAVLSHVRLTTNRLRTLINIILIMT